MSNQEMYEKAKEAMKNAYAPYSGFRVGSCIRTEDGSLFTGCNIENSSYSMTMCAEETALASLVSQGHRKIKEVVVLSTSGKTCPPCGACRQRLSEFADANTLIHLYDENGECETIELGELLPHPFRAQSMESQL